MTESPTWDRLVQAAYEETISAYLDSPMMRLLAEEHAKWWSEQTRWFRLRYRVRTAVSDRWDKARSWLAYLIYPEGRPYE